MGIGWRYAVGRRHKTDFAGLAVVVDLLRLNAERKVLGCLEAGFEARCYGSVAMGFHLSGFSEKDLGGIHAAKKLDLLWSVDCGGTDS